MSNSFLKELAQVESRLDHELQEVLELQSKEDEKILVDEPIIVTPCVSVMQEELRKANEAILAQVVASHIAAEARRKTALQRVLAFQKQKLERNKPRQCLNSVKNVLLEITKQEHEEAATRRDAALHRVIAFQRSRLSFDNVYFDKLEAPIVDTQEEDPVSRTQAISINQNVTQPKSPCIVETESITNSDDQRIAFFRVDESEKTDKPNSPIIAKTAIKKVSKEISPRARTNTSNQLIIDDNLLSKETMNPQNNDDHNLMTLKYHRPPNKQQYIDQEQATEISIQNHNLALGIDHPQRPICNKENEAREKFQFTSQRSTAPRQSNTVKPVRSKPSQPGLALNNHVLSDHVSLRESSDLLVPRPDASWEELHGDKLRIERRDICKLPYVLRAGDVLHWQFRLRELSIDFVVYKRAMSAGGATEIPIIPMQRFDSKKCYSGQYRAEDETSIVLVFDNSHAFFRSKQLAYIVRLERSRIVPESFTNEICYPSTAVVQKNHNTIVKEEDSYPHGNLSIARNGKRCTIHANLRLIVASESADDGIGIRI